MTLFFCVDVADANFICAQHKGVRISSEADGELALRRRVQKYCRQAIPPHHKVTPVVTLFFYVDVAGSNFICAQHKGVRIPSETMRSLLI